MKERESEAEKENRIDKIFLFLTLNFIKVNEFRNWGGGGLKGCHEQIFCF